MEPAKILIIDDDYSFAEFAKFLIHTLGHHALMSLNAGEGIEIAKMEKPDVILVDAGMPSMSGIEVIRRLKAEPTTKDIPVLLCSITKSRSEVQEAFGVGALNFIPKPLNMDVLQARINEALSRR